jgi:hypothetical protein
MTHPLLRVRIPRTQGGLVHALDGSVMTAACVVDQYIDAAEAFLGAAHRGPDSCGIGDVHLHDVYSFAVGSRPGVQFRGAPCREHYPVPRIESGFGEGQAETARRATGDEPTPGHGSITSRLISAPSRANRK